MVHDRLGPDPCRRHDGWSGSRCCPGRRDQFHRQRTEDFANANTVIIPVNPSPQSLGEWPTSVTDNGTWVTGWNIKNIYLSYDPKTGTLYVGINNWANANGDIAPFGQANGDPSGTATPYDPAHLGYGTPSSDKSIALGFSPTNPVNPTVPVLPW